MLESLKSMIKKQIYFILKLFLEFKPNLQKIVLQNYSKELIRFICECCAILDEGHFTEIRKRDLKIYEKILQRLLSKKTLLKERRFLLASARGLQLIHLITNQLICNFDEQFQ